MRKIRHLPYGINPYETCGYDRIPLHPAEGEGVVIRCMTQMDADSPVLHIKTDSMETVVTGRPDPACGEGCYRFSVGPFRAGEQVNYTFCISGEETESYRFTVSKTASLVECKKLWTNHNETFLSCVLAHDLPIRFRLSQEGNQFQVAAAENNVGSSGNIDYCTLKASNGYRIEIERAPLRVTLVSPNGSPVLSLGNASFELNGAGSAVRFHLELLAAGKSFYGFGEKFDRVNQKGLKPKNVVYEHFTRQGKHAYLPVPWLFTEAGWGLYCASDCEIDWDMTEETDAFTLLKISGETGSNGLPPFHFLTGSPAELLYEFQKLTGPCALPPEWAFGPWMSSNGWNTQKEALEQIERMRREKIPATVFVLEAWSDESTFYIFNGAQYQAKPGGAFSYQDFSFDQDGPWPDPKQMTDCLKDNGLHLVLWQIPVIKNAAENQSAQLTMDEKEAIEKEYCVKNADGAPYRIPDRWFAGSLVLDFTSPEAVNWWFQKRKYLIDELHVEGFKTDGGEFIYDPDTRFHNGKTGADMRNPYPAVYSDAYYRFLQNEGHGGVAFSRAGYTGAQKSPIHWAGDQLSTFGEMRAQLRAGLSAGLSGIPFWGFDLAGFAGDLPSTELYLRAVEMAAFSPVMQFHSEPRSGQFGDNRRRSFVNDRSPWNMAEVNQASEILEVYRKYANLRMELLPYIYREAQNCVKTGRPLLCHLIYDYANDGQVLNIEDEYLFGRDLLIAPVLEEGARKRSVYLPEGTWRDYWTKKPALGGETVEYDCPLDCIPVFIRESPDRSDTIL